MRNLQAKIDVSDAAFPPTFPPVETRAARRRKNREQKATASPKRAPARSASKSKSPGGRPQVGRAATPPASRVGIARPKPADQTRRR
ncbi:MAG: hypothetical protein QGG01_11615, partial [Roseibacillus sp.]|nr:hypothetical protein [Roseibacillus sp.]